MAITNIISGEYLHIDEVDITVGRSGEDVSIAFSLDPFAGGTFGTKPIWDVPTINANLNRTGFDWYTNNGTVLADNVLNFGFWNTQNDFFGTGYINDDFDTAFSEFFDFQALNPAQRDAARFAIGLWDDLIAVDFVETDVATADIRFGMTDTGGAQAYAYLPFGTIFNDPPGSGGFTKIEDLGGDVWIDYTVGSNFFPLTSSFYASTTLIHEIGHGLGLSHPGDYNATDDNDGDGVPDPITYAGDAFYAQDSLQYSIMSYFDAFETGAQHIDWTLMNFAYPSTPMVHDIAAIQAIYGADLDTRVTDTVYGFNSTADRSVFDFEINTRPVISIYDAGGVDTLDFSGWDTPSVIDLNEGAFSSGGGTEEFLTLAEINANRAAAGFGARSQATYDLYVNLFKNPQGLTSGLFKDNISIAYGTVIENAVGGGGDDVIVANNVANIINGGGGLDIVSYETALSPVVLIMGGFIGGGAAGDTLISIEGMIGTSGNDILVGDNGDNVIDGGTGGNDVMNGFGGVDTLSYAKATAGVTIDLGNGKGGGVAKGDTFLNFENVTGTDFADKLNGNAGNNVLKGGDGDDIINGGDGMDMIYGGAGADVMSGGKKADTFVFTMADADGSLDRIKDFVAGTDKIDLSAIDANLGSAINDAFTFIGSTAFSGTAGELRYQGNRLQGDIDGDGVADIDVALLGSPALTIADLIL